VVEGTPADALSWSLLAAAIPVGLIHTALGPDHYLPFVMLARARGWSHGRTAWITGVCGTGHVLASLLLAGACTALGLSLARLETIDLGRGALAAWLLVAFGVAYGTWGARKALRVSRGLEPHAHGHRVHLHRRGDQPHAHAGPKVTPTFWTLFVVFVLGPCEPLIPLVMLPAARGRWLTAAGVALVFGLTTVVTMVGLTLLQVAGLKRLDFGPLERWSHALSGAIIAASGLAVIWLGT